MNSFQDNPPTTETAEMEKQDKDARAKTKIRRMRRGNCKLNSNDGLSLHDVLQCFNGPISREQAWALCHQTVKTLLRLPYDEMREITEFSQIILHKDGHVVLELQKDAQSSMPTEQKVIFSLGILIFKALDFGMDEKEERPLSPDLEDLITTMTHGDEECEPDTEEKLQETDDEGIERDSGEVEMDDLSMSKNDGTCSLKSILQMCTRHAQGSEDHVDTHYRAVIRAFVSEALELSQFLEKVTAERKQANLKNFSSHAGTRHGATSSQHLDTLSFDDWARFWVQVIGELRNGVKLKKVEENLGKRGRSRGRGRGAEFELTPYEILMDDIRERRYRLRKTPAPVPNASKDARTIVLDFIRSRPPLKKASDRQLPPAKKQSTIRELLMESIKKPPRPLRSCSQRLQQQSRLNNSLSLQQENTQDNSNLKGLEGTTKPRRGSTEADHTVMKQSRKVIPVDFDLKLDVEEDEDDEDDDDEDFAVTRFEDDDDTTNVWESKEAYRSRIGTRPGGCCDLEDEDEDKSSANPWRKTGGLRLTRNEYHRFCDAQLESYDLATQCPSRRASVRKHTGRGSTASFLPLTGTSSVPHSRPQSRQHTGVMSLDTRTSLSPSPNASPSLSPRPRERASLKGHGIASSEFHEQNVDQGTQKASLGDMFLDERLSLTLEEIVHIRSVLTKAELESLPVEGRVKEDVEKRRVCFLCLKTRFGLLGPWGQRCRLCERTVCVKCYSKMRIPTEHFAHVPVVLLSPGLLMSPSNSEPESGSRSPWPRPGGAVGSAPASPAPRRRDPALSNATPASTPNSTPAENTTPGTTPNETQSTDKRYQKIGGSPSRLLTNSAFGALGGLSTDQRLVAERMRGVAMVVCHDCRIMVIQIIKSSRTTRATIRNNVISRLTLNLSPAYV
ncbi:protein spire isoform X2 [Venturia canescens]|uniref:protein spire isoform X2 n=1 Tax=Venturia canescens TaxID=32260 RepID=UPI001C9BEA65|nr:protein spire isoform X2 [Venturia canescens]